MTWGFFSPHQEILFDQTPSLYIKQQALNILCFPEFKSHIKQNKLFKPMCRTVKCCDSFFQNLNCDTLLTTVQAIMSSETNYIDAPFTGVVVITVEWKGCQVLIKMTGVEVTNRTKHSRKLMRNVTFAGCDKVPNWFGPLKQHAPCCSCCCLQGWSNPALVSASPTRVGPPGNWAPLTPGRGSNYLNLFFFSLIFLCARLTLDLLFCIISS